MGLDVSHDAWGGSYIAFHRWRKELAVAAGLPPLDLMEGFVEGAPVGLMRWLRFGCPNSDLLEQETRGIPIRWKALRPSPLHILLRHSDCDGEIAPEDCALIADELENLLPQMAELGEGGGHIAGNGGYAAVTQRFIDGCRAAAMADEPLTFF